MPKQNTNIFLIVIIILVFSIFIPNNFIARLINDCTSGCIHSLDTGEQVCLPVGTRLPDQTYCNIDNTLKNQVSDNCIYNYECTSNICIEGKCKSYFSLKKSYCESREALGYESYDTCMVEVS